MSWQWAFWRRKRKPIRDQTGPASLYMAQTGMPGDNRPRWDGPTSRQPQQPQQPGHFLTRGQRWRGNGGRSI